MSYGKQKMQIYFLSLKFILSIYKSGKEMETASTGI